jgi:hypothetical protein
LLLKYCTEIILLYIKKQYILRVYEDKRPREISEPRKRKGIGKKIRNFIVYTLHLILSG